MKQQSIRTTQGFTLIELLIAMTLVGLIMVLVFSGLRMGSRSWDAGEAKTTANEELRLSLGWIARSLRQARVLTRFVPHKGSLSAFEGDTEVIRFVTPMLEYLGIGGLYWVVLEMDTQEEGRLMARWRPFRADEDPEFGSFKEKVVLVDGVEHFEVDYFGVLAATGEVDWVEKWDQQVALPTLVRIRLTVRGQQWPDLVTPILSAPITRRLQ